MNRSAKVDLVTEIMKGIINGGITPNEFFVGLHNTFYHGTIFEENDYECSDEQLENLFAHLECLSYDSKKIR